MAASVNLDAMILREDFSTLERELQGYERKSNLTLSDLDDNSLMTRVLRKPDFQRETNHWSPEQIVSLLECFVDGELIPSVILWESKSFVFVIDGGHRLSALRAWILDDYGDGPASSNYFGRAISKQQDRTANRTRTLIKEKVGTWKHHLQTQQSSSPDTPISARATTIATRGLPIQWVIGNAEKAEASFFRINTQGTPLDDIEELLLKNRLKPVAIAARAIVRAGKGHKYWSRFKEEPSNKIEELASELHSHLFKPEPESPVKTLDLPLGGPIGVRKALEVIIDFLQITLRTQTEDAPKLSKTSDDLDGTETIKVLENALKISQRLTGNGNGSLGLHPAVYFYGPTGRHSLPMFMGTVMAVHRAIINNDKSFFQKLSQNRARLENSLILHKDLIASILQKTISGKRNERYRLLFTDLIDFLNTSDQEVTESDMIKLAGMEGKVLIGVDKPGQGKFSEDTKSKVLISKALASALKCSICGGYLDATKSLSYDHMVRAREGGTNDSDNCGLTHPYCNQSIKN